MFIQALRTAIKGLQMPATALAVSVPAALGSVAGLTENIGRLSIRAVSPASLAMDLGNASFGSMANAAAGLTAKVGKATTDATNTTRFFMGQPGGGGANLQAMHDGAANAASMNAALAAQRASAAAALNNN